MPEEHRAYGAIGCWAVTGSDSFVMGFLLKEQAGAGKIASTMAVSAGASTQSAATVTTTRSRARLDFLLQTHLPTLTRGLTGAVDTALRKAYTVAFGKSPLDPEGVFSGRHGPAFTRDLMGLRTSRGGVGCAQRRGACRSSTAS